MRNSCGMLGVLLLAACGQGAEQASVTEAAASAPASNSAPAAPAAPVLQADKAALAQPCLFTKEQVASALNLAVDSATPETMGDMAGCTYQGAKGSLRLNLIWHDPVYFEQATQMTRGSRPGEKIDLPGDADKAWMQFDGPTGGNLHYYRKNLEVELVPLLISTPGRDAIQAALLKLPRVP
ncbi:DUF3558 family protein [Novosphingobium sp. B 225]|uniref:DUF3558 family protein n=1 Tax=Novosphingobium sp. B 225 TaxID=1961849 RepID=UPI000B4B0867|nr:DUF3558 family protein [Novosphingobium sp. B 225]